MSQYGSSVGSQDEIEKNAEKSMQTALQLTIKNGVQLPLTNIKSVSVAASIHALKLLATEHTLPISQMPMFSHLDNGAGSHGFQKNGPDLLPSGSDIRSRSLGNLQSGSSLAQTRKHLVSSVC